MKVKQWMIWIIVILVAWGCAKTENGVTKQSVLIRTDISSLHVPVPSEAQSARFNAETPADTVWNAEGIPGLKTANLEFAETVLLPALKDQRDYFNHLDNGRKISELALFIYQAYRSWFGPSFYRWGGDLKDLDDPQPKGIAAGRRYGLDCSGFTSAPYELAVMLGMLTPEQALFSSAGLEKYCQQTGFEDRGALNGGGNRFRPDTRELNLLGEEILRIEKGKRVSRRDIRRLQPGDIAGRHGHFGIITEIDGELFYLESGGWVCPPEGWYPVRARQALIKFAENGYVSVRRCL